jgi:hypothetical protein
MRRREFVTDAQVRALASVAMGRDPQRVITRSLRRATIYLACATAAAILLDSTTSAPAGTITGTISAPTVVTAGETTNISLSLRRFGVHLENPGLMPFLVHGVLWNRSLSLGL